MIAATITSAVVPVSTWPGRIAILLPTEHPSPRFVAEALAERLLARGYRADVLDSPSGLSADYDALVLGARADSEEDLRAIAQYLEDAHGQLSHVATALFLVYETSRVKHDPLGEIADMVTRLHWRPDLACAFQDDEAKHGAMMRWLIHHVTRRHELSVSSPADIDRFADATATGLTRAAVTGDLARLRALRHQPSFAS
jgi:menaquinone-dependent protoporphyrinogen IX oxidase